MMFEQENKHSVNDDEATAQNFTSEINNAMNDTEEHKDPLHAENSGENTACTAEEAGDAVSSRKEEPAVEAETASTVYTPSGTFTYRDISKDGKKPSGRKSSRRGVLVLSIALSLALLLGLFGGAGGMLALFMHYTENGGNAPVQEDDASAGLGEEDVLSATIYKQTASVNVVELPEAGAELSVSQVYAKVSDSVVAISTSVQMTSIFYGGFYVTTGAGSGVIISSEGYIVTNYHVVEGATEIQVTLQNGNVYDALYLDGDKALDIALLKIAPTETLTAAEIGSSDALLVGQEVVAVGNPLGIFPGTVTDGIVSAINRVVEIEGYTHSLIQTDAAVNPGNSGGGLFDRYGRLVGIVNAKESSEGVEGLGFAIPIDSVFDELVEIIEDGYIHGRAALNLEMREITDVNEAYNLYRNRQAGIYIQTSGYGEEINISEGDRLHSVNGVEITTESDLHSVLCNLKPGDEVVLQLGRVKLLTSGFWVSYTEQIVEVTVTLEEYIPEHSITFD